MDRSYAELASLRALLYSIAKGRCYEISCSLLWKIVLQKGLRRADEGPKIPTEERKDIKDFVRGSLSSMQNEFTEERDEGDFNQSISELFGDPRNVYESLPIAGGASVIGKNCFLERPSYSSETSKLQDICVMKYGSICNGFGFFDRLKNTVVPFLTHIRIEAPHLSFVTAVLTAMEKHFKGPEYSGLPWATKRHVTDRASDLIIGLMYFGVGWYPKDLLEIRLLEASQLDIASVVIGTSNALKMTQQMDEDNTMAQFFKASRASERVYTRGPYGVAILAKPWADLMASGQTTEDFAARIYEASMQTHNLPETKAAQLKSTIAKLDRIMEGPELQQRQTIGLALIKIVGRTVSSPVAAFMLSSIGYGCGTTFGQSDAKESKPLIKKTALLFAHLFARKMPSWQDVECELLEQKSQDPKLVILRERMCALLKKPQYDSVVWWAELFMNRILNIAHPKSAKSKGVYFQAAKNIIFNSLGSNDIVSMCITITTYLAAKEMGITGQNWEENLSK
jgi:hypothetical protein